MKRLVQNQSLQQGCRPLLAARLLDAKAGQLRTVSQALCGTFRPSKRYFIHGTLDVTKPLIFSLPGDQGYFSNHHCRVLLSTCVAKEEAHGHEYASHHYRPRSAAWRRRLVWSWTLVLGRNLRVTAAKSSILLPFGRNLPRQRRRHPIEPLRVELSVDQQ